MSDVKKIHANICPHFDPILDLSLDGVQESKSSSSSVDIYTVSFNNCQNVYPVKIIKTMNKFKIDEQLELKKVISDINENQCIIRTCICDNPKRSFLKCVLCHSSSFACEYCISKAHYIKKKDKKGHLAWPFSTCNGEMRTIEQFIEITTKLENGEILTKDEAKGIVGTSHLLHQENFHLISDLPAEYMHSTCLGGVKRMVELTFNVGETRQRVTKRKLSDVSLFNKLISSVKVTRECSRRIRNLDFGVYKAQEYRNIILFFFNIVCDCIEEKFKRERKMWLQLAFIVRACVISNKEFDQISKNVIQNAGKSFYKTFESMHGQHNCTYSIHLIGSHMLQIRGDDPLTSRSAFKFENFYSEMRNMYHPGSIATSKQIILNCFMKRQLEKHYCEKSIFYDVEKRGRENNSLVYYMNEEKKYSFFKIIKVNPNGTFTCNPQGKYPFQSEIAKELKWEKVGVFKVGPFSTEEVVIERKQIEGKIIKVNDLFITCPNNVLREQ